MNVITFIWDCYFNKGRNDNVYSIWIFVSFLRDLLKLHFRSVSWQSNLSVTYNDKISLIKRKCVQLEKLRHFFFLKIICSNGKILILITEDSKGNNVDGCASPSSKLDSSSTRSMLNGTPNFELFLNRKLQSRVVRRIIQF